MAVDMNTNNTTYSNNTQPSEQKSKTSVDYQSFLKLLVAQMKNQDPTKPMDSTQYVAQLATFSQVEQSVQMNKRLEYILQSSALSQADSLIGRQLTSADGKDTGVVSDGLIAILANGKEVPVLPGVSIKPAPTT